jgi:hypothetical protein
MLLGVCSLSLALVVITAAKYRFSGLTTGLSILGFVSLLATLAFLWFAGRRAIRRSDKSVALRSMKAGLALGLLWVVEISINNLIAPPLPGRDIVDDLFWAAIAAGILVLAVVSVRRTGRLTDGIEAGFWAGLASGMVACCTALLLIVCGMRFITGDPVNVSEWAARGGQSGAPSMAAYFAFETLAGALMHLIVLGVLQGVLLGVLGGAAGKAAISLRNPR